jgi:outer membrane protein TolC
MCSIGWDPSLSPARVNRPHGWKMLKPSGSACLLRWPDAYFDAVEQRNQLALLKQQIKVDRDLLELTELRFNAGLTASVDVLQQSSQLAETESLVPPNEALLRVSENRLDVLSGQAPDAMDRVDRRGSFIDIGDLPFVGVPSDLLLNRPDLRAFRNELIAADAEIGRAIAERLPRIVLDGSFFYEDGWNSPDWQGHCWDRSYNR